MRTFIAVLVGKILLKFSRTFKIGGGSAAPGLYALKIHPGLIETLISQIPQNVIITGTNGKTTTSRMLSHFAKANNIKVIRNSTGSNLERGIASTLIHHSSLIVNRSFDLGIWEIDEAVFNTAVFKIKPQVIVLLNAFRDQLDRYGEVDSILSKWRKTLETIDWDPLIILNGSDPKLNDLIPDNFQKSFFGVKNQSLMWEGKKSEVTEKLDFEAILEKNRIEHTVVTLKYPAGKVRVNIPLPGIYNIYNFLAAFSASYHLNLNVNKTVGSLRGFSPAFGRFEKIKFDKILAYIFLIKNPAGASQVIETIAPHLKKEDRLLLALNDNLADGTDVSWIWDTHFEKFISKSELIKVIASGVRAQDMAVRLKYAGFPISSIIVESDPKKALQRAKQGLKGTLYLLPTYTAMLQFQKILTKSGLKKHYWEEK